MCVYARFFVFIQVLVARRLNIQFYILYVRRGGSRFQLGDEPQTAINAVISQYSVPISVFQMCGASVF
jgi:hypothetical protein